MSNDQFLHSAQERKPKQENSWKIHQVHNVKILTHINQPESKKTGKSGKQAIRHVSVCKGLILLVFFICTCNQETLD